MAFIVRSLAHQFKQALSTNLQGVSGQGWSSSSTFTNTLRIAANSCLFHTSPKQQHLMEFFDDKKNWGKSHIQVGRSWKTDELRIKSNEDLHKLWYVLLKEYNMLLTMEHNCKENYELFPNPERIDKVEESMRNLETVVRERNRAYWLLETGETGERPGDVVKDLFGWRRYSRFTEHVVPAWMNRRVLDYKVIEGKATLRFRKRMTEKLELEKKKYYRRLTRHVAGLWKRFPHMDAEMVQRMYPDTDVMKARESPEALGHHDQNVI